MTAAALACPICGGDMKISVTTNRNGKHAIGVHCPQDGRHFRGFINHKPYVEEVLRGISMAADSSAPAAAFPPPGDSYEVGPVGVGLYARASTDGRGQDAEVQLEPPREVAEGGAGT